MSDFEAPLAELYIGYYGRAPEPIGFSFWVGALENGFSVDAAAQDFAGQPETLALYPFLEAPDTNGLETFLATVYQNLFGRSTDAAGLSFWSGAIEGGLPLGTAILEIIRGAAPADQDALANRVALAIQWHDFALVEPDFVLEEAGKEAARVALALVTPDAASVAEGSAARDIIEAYFNDAPTLSISVLDNVLLENIDTTSPVKVADITVTDDNFGTNQLTLSGADAGLFALIGSEVFLKAGVTLDYESRALLDQSPAPIDLSVVLDDLDTPGGPDASQSLGLTVGNVNEAPTVSLSATVSELSQTLGTSVQIKVADITVTDDATGSNDLSLSGDDAALFELIGSELFLKVGTALDPATDAQLDVTVVVDDAAVGSSPDDTASLSLPVTGVNQVPSVSLANASMSVSEGLNTSARTKVADIVITDDSFGTNTLSLTGVNVQQFEIVGSELFLAAGAALDFETEPNLNVTIIVDDPAIGASVDGSVDFTLSIVDVNELPRVSVSSAVTVLAEDTDTSTRVKIADITVDDDALGTNTLSLSGGDAPLFEIDGTELFLRAGSTLDFETVPSFDLFVEVDDPAFPGPADDTASVFLTVSDVNEAPFVALTLASTEIPETLDTSNAFQIGLFTLVDDALGTTATTISGPDAAFFEIIGDRLLLKAGTPLDFETDDRLDITVSVDDPSLGTGPEFIQSVTFSITDVNEPADIQLLNSVTSVNDALSTATSIKIADIVITDDDTNPKSLTLSGSDAPLFTIVNDNALHLRAGARLDFERNPQLDVTVEVDDPTLPGAPDNSASLSIPVELGRFGLTNPESGDGGFVVSGSAAGDESGFAVSNAGDVNGDGFEDLIIGAVYADPGSRSEAGTSYVVFGKTDGTAVDLADVEQSVANGKGFAINGANVEDFSGVSVSGAGDVNGDGLADLIVGASGVDQYGDRSGGSYVVFGKSDSTTVELSDVAQNADGTGFVIYGTTTGDVSGRSVSSAGDVNGDGLSDLIVGSPGSDQNGNDDSGASYVVFGKTDGQLVDLFFFEEGRSNTQGFAITGASEEDNLGSSVSVAGDVNGDGLDDIIIGVSFANPNGNPYAGVSYVVFGKTNFSAIELSAGLTNSQGFAINGANQYDLAGRSVSNAGDVNGDGFDDLIVGAYAADPDGKTAAGISYVVFGGSNVTTVELSAGLGGTDGFIIRGASAGDYSGISVSSAGDVNGDGLDDLIVGASGAGRIPASLTASSFVIFGKSDGTTVELSDAENGQGGFVITNNDPNDFAGRAVHGAGDVNGDGFSDLIVGAIFDSFNGTYAGASFIVFGGDFNNATTEVGTTGDDTLTGTSAVDRLVAGTGNDTLIGNGSADVMRGGAGDDVFIISDLTFADIDGGTGSDTLALATNGLVLDLTVLDNTSLSGIERIDLRSNINGLTLDEIEVQRLSDTSNTLRVLSDDNDTVTFAGGNFAFESTVTDAEGMFDIYRSLDGEARVEVSRETSVIGAVVASVELSELESSSDPRGFVMNGASAFDYTGQSVSNAGDVNGDGFDDLIIGAFGADPDGKSRAGISYVIFGKTDGAVIELSDVVTSSTNSIGFAIKGADQGDYSGTSVSGAGDVNGDGFADLVVGAFYADPDGRAYAGVSYVVFGKSDGSEVELSDVENGQGGFAIKGASAFDYLGIFVSQAGDVNGDGLDDVIVGAARANPNGNVDAGAGYVVFGKTDGNSVELSGNSLLTNSEGFVINGESAFDRAGRAVSAAGDVNGDGLSDLLIGAPGADVNSLSGAGASYIVFGKTDSAPIDLSSVQLSSDLSGGFVVNGSSIGEAIAQAVSAAGDVNGDGIADVIVGAPSSAPDGNGGTSYVIFGKSDGSSVELSDVQSGQGGFAINGAASGDDSGRSVSSAGDVNGDGLSDLIVGARFADANGNLRAGASYVIFGKTDTAAVELSDVEEGREGFVINGASAYNISGVSVSAAGDVNGDGFDDLLVGATGDDPNSTSSGASFVIFGGNFTGAATQVGGAGADVLSGTDGDDNIFAGTGNDTLRTSAGQDRLSGGNGADEFEFLNVTGQTELIDFVSAERDRMDVSAFGFGNFASLQAVFSADGFSGDNTRIDLDADTSVIVIGVAVDDLTSGDFIL